MPPCLPTIPKIDCLFLPQNTISKGAIVVGMAADIVPIKTPPKNHLHPLHCRLYMNKKIILLYSTVFTYLLAHAQFAPPAGMAGSTAIAKSDATIQAWATGCTIERGWVNIADTSLGRTTVGTSGSAIGEALSNGIVSLGDGGSATCSFSTGLTNGPGFDFAVFENSFTDDFLELAFVEVSSDGIDWVRFPAVSNTQDTLQIDTFGLIDARALNNLAGKYRAGYGTPFDLEELKDSSRIDINDISFVRIVDVVGSLTAPYATLDKNNHRVNDPWPTPFPSSGFDLDAIAIMHPKYMTGIIEQPRNINWRVVSTLLTNEIDIQHGASKHFELIQMTGQLIATFEGEHHFSTLDLPTGLYMLRCIEDNGSVKLFKP